MLFLLKGQIIRSWNVIMTILWIGPIEKLLRWHHSRHTLVKLYGLTSLSIMPYSYFAITTIFTNLEFCVDKTKSSIIIIPFFYTWHLNLHCHLVFPFSNVTRELKAETYISNDLFKFSYPSNQNKIKICPKFHLQNNYSIFQTYDLFETQSFHAQIMSPQAWPSNKPNNTFK